MYEDNIGRPLTEERVWALYEWKNGSPMAARKKTSVQDTYISRLQNLPALLDVEAGRHYLTYLRVGQTGGVWDIFWVHCIAPNLFPIFDQHTYRAMQKILNGAPSELSKRRDLVLAAYFDEYLPFLDQFAQHNSRSVDRALFAYGRFLNSEFAMP